MQPKEVDSKRNEFFMRLALSLAETAASFDEVPVGAVVVKNDRVIGTGFNYKESAQSALSHAEILAIKSASEFLNAWRLIDCDLYVTLEPCLMCAGAIYQSRVKNVFFGAKDPKGGALGSLYQINEDTRLNHQVKVAQGLLANECSQILTNFFKEKR